jgi:hypothetical protein
MAKKKPNARPDTQEVLRKVVPKRVRDELAKRAKAIRDRAPGSDRGRR